MIRNISKQNTPTSNSTVGIQTEDQIELHGIQHSTFSHLFHFENRAIQNETRRLVACTQAVVILRSVVFPGLYCNQAKCFAFEVVNSLESMCLCRSIAGLLFASSSTFDCISWNRLLSQLLAFRA